MIGIYSIILGIFIAAISLMLLRKEFQNSFFPVKGKKVTDDDAVVYDEIVKIEEIINSMNEAFYDLIEDMEGRSSLHDFEIKSINEKIETIEEELFSLKKEVQAIKNIKIKEENIVLPDINKQAKDYIEEPIEEEPIVKYEKEDTDIKNKIILLRSRGMSVNQIARELNLGIGEINLILNMKK